MDSRISAYFKELGDSELWPSIKPFEELSISDLIERFDSTKLSLSHSCDAGAACPLFNGLAELRRRVDQIEKGVKGLDLSSFRVRNQER
jgi:hypothetical protein